MKRKLLTISISVAIAIVLSSIILYFFTKERKPNLEEVRFEISTNVLDWQTLYLKCDSKYYLCTKTNDVYTATIKKTKNSVIRYTFILADEWGNTYGDVATDIDGYKNSSKLLIVDSARFMEDLSGYKTLDTEFSLVSDLEGEISVYIDGESFVMDKTADNSYYINVRLGIGYHSYYYSILTENGTKIERDDERQIIVSKNSTQFFDSAVFDFDSSRQMNLWVNITPMPTSLFLYLQEDNRLVKTQLTEGEFYVSFNIDDDCNFLIFVSTTNDESGINYDAVFSGNTEDYADDFILTIEN